MNVEKTPFDNPFTIILSRVANVERQLQDLKEKLAQSKINPVNSSGRLTRKEVQREYKVSLSTIHNLMRQGKLHYEKVGRKTLFRREDVERCFTNNRG